MKIPDGLGRQEYDIELSGLGDLHTPVPVKKWDVENWDEEIALSLDAGEYICNETYFRTHEASEQA